MTEDPLRQIMATHILNMEARRDRLGRLCLDRAGLVPGLLGRPGSDKVARLIEEGAFERADAAAVSLVARYTDKMAGVARDPGVELVLRDICWQSGPKAANEAVQRALALDVSGRLDDGGRQALRGAERAAHGLLRKLQEARGIGLVSAEDQKRWTSMTRLGISLSPRRFTGDGLKAA